MITASVMKELKSKLRKLLFRNNVFKLPSLLLIYKEFNLLLICVGYFARIPFQLTFNCSKSIIETLEKSLKYVQCSKLTLNIFYTFFSVFIFDFKQVNVVSIILWYK